MKKGWIIGGVAVLALCAVVAGKIMKPKQFAEGVADPIVGVTQPETRDIVIRSSLVGSIEPEEVVYVYPKAGGDVTDVYVKAGDRIEAGQVICVIDTKQVISAKSQLESAELALRQAQEELQRQTILYQSGGVSEQAYQQYQDNVTSARIAYNSAKDNYENQLSYSEITAPISGVVEVCDIEVHDTVAQNNLVCVISGEGAKTVTFSTTERIRKNLNEGDGIVVEKDGVIYRGTITEVSSMADLTTGLYKVKAYLDDADGGELPTGSSVKLYVISNHSMNTMAVPIDSVYYDGGKAYVYTYDNGVLHKVAVETGLSDEEYTEITGGLDGTELVLTTWSSELYEGAKVRLKADTEDTGAAEAETEAAEAVTETSEAVSAQ